MNNCLSNALINESEVSSFSSVVLGRMLRVFLLCLKSGSLPDYQALLKFAVEM